jgi:hypothetical protein
MSATVGPHWQPSTGTSSPLKPPATAPGMSERGGTAVVAEQITEETHLQSSQNQTLDEHLQALQPEHASHSAAAPGTLICRTWYV